MRILFGSRGQSLIQVVIAAGIMSVVVMSFATMMNGQQRSAAQAGQKIASLDMVRAVTTALSDPSGVCNYMVNNPALAPFDPLTVGSASPPVFSFTQIPMTGVAGSNPAVMVSASTPASPLSGSLFVNSIKLTDLACVPGPCTAATTKYSANVLVGFDGSRLISALYPLKFPVSLTTAPVGASQQIIGCNGKSVSSLSTDFNTYNSPAGGVTYNCPAGESVLFCYTFLGPSGNHVCETSVGGGGNSCSVAGCTAAAVLGGTAWYTELNCGKLN